MSVALKVDGLRMEFGGLVAVKDVSFEVAKGEMVGLIGPNGCGKSTTFNCISGLLEQTRGRVEVFGKDASTMRPEQIQRLKVTRTFQHTRLWREMTVIENLLVPPRNQFRPLDVLWKGRKHAAEQARLARAFPRMRASGGRTWRTTSRASSRAVRASWWTSVAR